jgi:hypothetical protein
VIFSRLMIGEPPAPHDAAPQPGELPAGPSDVSAAERAPVAVVELAVPEYPPPASVPLPPPPISLRMYHAPVVDDVSPSSGSVLGDTKLTLVGTHLFRASIVRIGGIIAQSIGADEPRELRVLTPSAERAGEVDITIENPFVPPLVLPRAFRYEPLAAPVVRGVAPGHVATRGGGEITVTGEHFVRSTAVFLDGKPVENPRFVSATTIDVTVPPGDDGKLVDVTVKNPDGQTATAPRAFKYDRRFG